MPYWRKNGGKATSEQLAACVPLPEELDRELVFDLRRWKPDSAPMPQLPELRPHGLPASPETHEAAPARREVMGWVLFVASPSDPPPEEQPCALSRGLEQWLPAQPPVRVRCTLPIVKDGNTIGIHVGYDRA